MLLEQRMRPTLLKGAGSSNGWYIVLLLLAQCRSYHVTYFSRTRPLIGRHWPETEIRQIQYNIARIKKTKHCPAPQSKANTQRLTLLLTHLSLRWPLPLNIESTTEPIPLLKGQIIYEAKRKGYAPCGQLSAASRPTISLDVSRLVPMRRKIISGRGELKTYEQVTRKKSKKYM